MFAALNQFLIYYKPQNAHEKKTNLNNPQTGVDYKNN
jgi:hypothetical protein